MNMWKWTHFWIASGSGKKSKGEKKKNLETNKNGNTTYQNLWDVAKAVLREKVIVTNTVLRNKKDLK